MDDRTLIGHGTRMDVSDERLIELETKVAHHEFTIENLQQAAFDQAATIHKLEKVVKELKERFDGATGEGQDIGPHNVKPPHY